MTEQLTVTTERVDDIPVLIASMERMGLAELIDEHFVPHGNWRGISVGKMLTGWLTHILSEADHRLNQVQDWAAKRIETLTDGREIRQFVHVSDVCAGFHAAFGAGGPGPYDVASFEWTPVRRVADLIAELTGAEVVPGTRTGSSPVSANVGRVPGWLPQVSLCDGLARMVEEFRRRKAVAQ